MGIFSLALGAIIDFTLSIFIYTKGAYSSFMLEQTTGPLSFCV